MVGFLLMLNTEAIRVETLGNGAKLGHIVVEFRQDIIPKVICCDGLAVYEFVFVLKEGLDIFILAQELEDTTGR